MRKHYKKLSPLSIIKYTVPRITLREHRKLDKIIAKLPLQVVKKYELWKDLVFRHGPNKLKEFPGFHDEVLKGNSVGQHSSRLNLQYRVIYRVEKDIVTVYVIDITAHDYKGVKNE
jgi:plasmid maintenance system killer protein